MFFVFCCLLLLLLFAIRNLEAPICSLIQLLQGPMASIPLIHYFLQVKVVTSCSHTGISARAPGIFIAFQVPPSSCATSVLLIKKRHIPQKPPTRSPYVSFGRTGSQSHLQLQKRLEKSLSDKGKRCSHGWIGEIPSPTWGLNILPL